MVATYDDIFNPIKGKEEQIIKWFVKYYGEENRAKIENRINNMEFIFVSKDPKRDITEFYNKKTLEIKNQFFNESGITIDKDEIESVRNALKDNDYDNDNLQNILWEMGFEDMPEDVLEQEDNYNLVFNKLNQCEKLWDNKYQQKHDEILKEKEQYMQLFKGEERESEREDIARKEYYKNVGNYISDNINAGISDYEMNTVIHIIEILHNTGKEKLNDEFIVNDNLKELFISVFKLLGYDYGEDYDRYINDTNLLNSVFDKDLIKYMQQQKEQRDANRKPVNFTIRNAVERIKQLDVKGGCYNILKGIYAYGLGFMKDTIAYNQSYINSKNEIRNICVLPLGTNLSTETVIHESGHAVLSDVLSVDDCAFVAKSGFQVNRHYFANNDLDEYKKATNQEDIESSNNQYKYIDDENVKALDEVINDLITTGMASKARAEGFVIGLKDMHNTSYSNAFPMMKDFVYKNIKLMKFAQINRDPMILANHMGIDNFERLSRAVFECIEIH